MTLAAPRPAVPAPAPTAPSSPMPQRRSLWRTLWPLLAPYKGLILLALALNALHGVAISFQMLMPKYLIAIMMDTGLSAHGRWVKLGGLVATYLFASLIGRMAVWHIGYRVFTFVREKVVFALRGQFFRHVNHLCLRFHIKHNSGELYSYLFGTPLQQLQGFFSQFTLQVPGAIVTLVVTILWVGIWDPMLTGVLLILVVANVILLQYVRKRIHVLNSEYQRVESNVSGYVADLLRGSRHVKLYAMEDRVADDFQARAWEIGQKVYHRDVQTHIQWMKQEAVGYTCFALLCAALLWRYQSGRVKIEDVSGYLAAFIGLQAPLNMLFQISGQKAAAQAGLERIDAVLQTASTTPDPIGYEAEVPRKGDILLYGVNFAYEAESGPVLRDVDLTIPYGQRVALVGPSGAGKSTITQLLLRLYDPDQGAVLIGGLNIRHCRGPELRRHFGVVPQDPFIFRVTVRENLRVLNPTATDADIRRACELANAWEFIEKMPRGLDTLVGEGGSTLSGGQRQRLAIARALLTDPDFFIFDEATSALDTVSEHMIQTALEGAMRGRTSLVIAHRLATVKNCDRILVLREGQVVQDGTYDQLVSQPGLFRDLVQGQVLRS